MFGWQPQFNSFPDHNSFDPSSYQKLLQVKLANPKDIVEGNIVQAAKQQKTGYDLNVHTRITTKYATLLHLRSKGTVMLQI